MLRRIKKQACVPLLPVVAIISLSHACYEFLLTIATITSLVLRATILPIVLTVMITTYSTA